MREYVDEMLLKAAVVAAGIMLGSILGYKLFLYSDIPIYWRIAIATFILFLPFYFFLQVSLNVKYTKDARMSHIRRIQQGIREFNMGIKEHLPKEDRFVPGHNVENDIDFLDMVRSRLDFLMNYNLQAYAVYRKAYATLRQKERTYSAQENRNRRLQLLDLEFYDFLKEDIDQEMKDEGISFRSYLLPLSFFLFTYFAGFLITLPLINSVFTGTAQTSYIPLFSTHNGIPILVIQWGFLGGFVYTSISLLSRFLRNDLIPRVYLLASLRLMLSAVVAIVIYFLYMLVHTNTNIPVNVDETYPQILLICFIAGVAPVQLLINFAD
jgi:hypothetical protein